MATITREELIKHDGEEITVWREKGKYTLDGTLNYQVIECCDLFFVEAKNDGCILKTGDEVELGKRKYDVEL